jgi:hypothetical protein
MAKLQCCANYVSTRILTIEEAEYAARSGDDELVDAGITRS